MSMEQIHSPAPGQAPNPQPENDGAALLAEKADGRIWRCGYASPTLYAAFPHLHFDGETALAQRFVKACETWKASMK